MKALGLAILVVSLGLTVKANPIVRRADIVIYGGTPAGISAAVQARKMGKDAVLIEPTRRIGGMTTGGLGATDIGEKNAIGGIARAFYAAVRDYYRDAENWTRQSEAEFDALRRANGTLRKTDPDTMWVFEPHAALRILEKWEKDRELDIVRGERLDRGPGGVVKEDGRIVSIRMESGRAFRGRVFLDCTYEGDLMAAAGVSYVVGREANSQYGETISGIQRARTLNHQFLDRVDPYVRKGDPSSGLLPFVERDVELPDGAGDGRVQAYCYRMCLTDDPENRIPFKKPEGYDPLDYELLLRNFEAPGDDGRNCPATARGPWINTPMPNRKTDTNNRTAFSTDFIGWADRWPEASYAEREEIAMAHLRYQQGLMWTLANDPRVPERVRNEVARWGTCKDEFVGERGDGWQNQLYVREARRMVGEYVMTEHNCRGVRRAKRPVGLGAYGMDSHSVRRYVTKEGFVRNEGNIEDYDTNYPGSGKPWTKLRPYPIDYGALVPKRSECRNLLVPVCLSASHMAFGSIRMEPVFFVLGQSAGTAAAIAAGDRCDVQDVDYPKLRRRLLEDGQVLEIDRAGWIDFNKNGVKDAYEDPARPVEERVRDLLSRMTLEEKTCQLATLYGSGRVLKDYQPTAGWKNALWKDGIANIDEELNGVGKCRKERLELVYPFSNHVAAVRNIQRWFVEETRLGIPVDFSNEGIHGLNHTKATPLPAPIGIGSTWNRALVREAGEIVGEEAKLIGYSNVYAPILDVARDPRWGRTLECYGEDPYLVGTLGAEMCAGIQSQGVASTLKHFAVYSVPKGGRDGECRTDPHVTPRELHEIFLAPFRRVIRSAHPMGVMCSYNDWNGEPIAASRYFLTELLRGEYGFDGYVVSDSEAVEYVHTKHAVAETPGDAVRMVLEAGLNVRTHFTPPEDFVRLVREQVTSGRLSMSVVDRRVAEVLSVKFRLGLFDNPYLGDAARADAEAGLAHHLDFADRIQAESFVLLKNDGTLPLDKSRIRRILITGPLADERNYMTSRYGPNGLDAVTIRRGIEDYLFGAAEVVYEKGCETVDPDWPDSEIVPTPLSDEEETLIGAAVAAAKGTDMVLAVLGEDEKSCGESRSRTSLELPGRQQVLLDRLLATGKPVVIVLVNGQPLTVNGADRHAAAILETWFPGCRGGRAVARTLFGEENPSGKLTVTFPKSVGQVEYNFPYKKGAHGKQSKWVENPNGSGHTRVEGPLYPFGHGLSYTGFAYSNLVVNVAGEGESLRVSVSCDVMNVGRCAGAEVVQLYVRDEYSSVVAYDSVLRGFEKVFLNPGESKRVAFALKPEDLAILDRDMKWAIEPGGFEVRIGSSSEDIRLRGHFMVL